MPDQFFSRPDRTHLRKKLRSNLTPAEATLWKYISRKQLDGFKFRRQHSVGIYILDFYCAPAKLAIELDGAHHFTSEGAEYDHARDEYLIGLGVKVLRFENKEVFENLEGALEVIKQALHESNYPPPCRSAALVPRNRGTAIGFGLPKNGLLREASKKQELNSASSSPGRGRWIPLAGDGGATPSRRSIPTLRRRRGPCHQHTTPVASYLHTPMKPLLLALTLLTLTAHGQSKRALFLGNSYTGLQQPPADGR